MRDTSPDDVAGSQIGDIYGGALRLCRTAGQADGRQSFGVRCVNALHLEADRFADARENGDILDRLAGTCVHRLLARNNAAHPGQGGEVYVQIQFAVAEQCGALQNGTRCLRPFQHRQG